MARDRRSNQPESTESTAGEGSSGRTKAVVVETGGNRFDRMEWAGAFGDLGTLIPFVVAYLSVARIDPLGVLFAFGVALIAAGAYYRTPFPVQPMKAIGVVVATQAAAMTPGAIFVAGLVTGLFWLLLGVCGVVGRVVKIVERPVLMGIILGLGFGFMMEGVKMMSSNWTIASVGFLGTLLLLTNKTLPAMLVLLLFGLLCGLLLHPGYLDQIAAISINFRIPEFSLSMPGWSDLMIGVLLLALPQIPLTLGNAVMAINEENNRLFPNRPVSERGVAISTGLLNLFSASVGGVPMCHGAGGMAGHVAFGARTGGAPIILGVILLITALFFSDSINLFLQILPNAILGVVLFVTGAQLALGSGSLDERKGKRFITLITAAFAVWNVGFAFLIGIGATYLDRRGWLRL